MGSTTPAAVHLTVKLLFSTAAQEFCQVFIIIIIATISSSNVLLGVSSSSRSASLTAAAAALAPGPSGFERRILAGNEKADKAVIHPEEQLFLSSTDPVWHSDEGNVPYFLLNCTTTTLTTVAPARYASPRREDGALSANTTHGRTDGRADVSATGCFCCVCATAVD